MIEEAIRVVYDCVVLLQGAASRKSPSRACLEIVDSGQVCLCLSEAVLLDIQDVLGRDGGEAASRG